MRKKFKLLSGVLVLICIMLLSGCGDKNQAEETVKTKYIGDNSKVTQIAYSLPYPKGVSFDSIQIQSSKAPYELKVFVKIDNKKSVDFQKCAEYAFDRIENMGIISFYDKSNSTLIKSFHRK